MQSIMKPIAPKSNEQPYHGSTKSQQKNSRLFFQIHFLKKLPIFLGEMLGGPWYFGVPWTLQEWGPSGPYHWSAQGDKISQFFGKIHLLIKITTSCGENCNNKMLGDLDTSGSLGLCPRWLHGCYATGREPNFFCYNFGRPSIKTMSATN